MRIRPIVAAFAALLLAISLIVIGVLAPPGQRSGRQVPTQWSGTAAGKPHRTSAAATLGRVVNGRVVTDAASAARAAGRAGQRAALPTARAWTARVPGAIPPATRPRPLRLPISSSGTETVTPTAGTPAAPVSGFNPATSRQLPLSGATQVTYANADGTKTTFVYQHPVNYQLPNGTWAPVSTTLVPAAASGAPAASTSPSASAPASQVTPSASGSPSAAVSAAPSASSSVSPSPTWTAPSGPASLSGWTEQSVPDPATFAPVASAQDLVSLPLDGSHVVAFGVAGAVPVAGEATGSTVSYPDAAPDSTISYTAGDGSVKEQIVLDSPSAPTTWVFPLDLTGLHALIGPGGIVEFVDSSGRIDAYVPRGTMTDSNIDPHSGDGATSGGVRYSLVTVGGRAALQVTLDAAWLDSKARVYPVTVDPTITNGYGSIGTVYVQGNTSDSNDFSGTDVLKVGTYDGGTDTAKSFLSFGTVPTQLKNAQVLGVQLDLFETWAYSCQNAQPIWISPITSSWSPSSVTGPPGPSTGGAITESKPFAYAYKEYGSSTSNCPAPGGTPADPGGWVAIKLKQAATDLVNGWTHGTVTDYGLAISASDTNSYGWKQFAAYASSGVGSPQLVITYSNDGASYKLLSRRPVKPVLPSQNGTFALQVTNTGETTWPAGSSSPYQMSYEAFTPKGVEKAAHPVFSPLPSSVAPGQTVPVNVTVDSLSSGTYQIDFEMYNGANGSKPEAFSSEGIAPYPIALSVPVVVTVSNVFPPSGYISPVLRQQLSTSATATGTLTYKFTITCAPLSGQKCPISSPVSDSPTESYWTPPASDMAWNIPYTWSVVITGTSGTTKTTVTISGISIEDEVPQPAVTSGLGSTSGLPYDPLSGNYTTSATDAAVAGAGLPLQIDRTYNSLDPRASDAFGAGWSTMVDSAVRPDNDGTGNVTVTLQDGKQVRFGLNGDGKTYSPPFGSHDVLTGSTSAGWTLKDASGDQYTFTPAGVISKITDPNGQSLLFTVTNNEVTTIKDSTSGRFLTVAWTKPSGAQYSHVASVTTQGAATGQSGFTWSYVYSGDTLTDVCGPSGCSATGCPSGCTVYTYGSSGSHYLAGVLDSGPRTYWQLGDGSGATTAVDEVDANLGTTDGTYNSVTLGVSGPLAGSSETAASFNGTSSTVSLPPNLLSDSTDEAIGLWFEAPSGASGVLFSYETQPIAKATGDHEPVLYIGTNGDLYGEFWNGKVDPIVTSSAVTDGKWHYVVISAESSTQSMYLDGKQVGSTLSGTVDNLNMGVDTIGAGDWASWTSNTSSTIGYFKGDIAQVAVYAHPLGSTTVATQYALATTASPELTQVTLPSDSTEPNGRVYEQATYDHDTDRVATYTDHNEGKWTISQPFTSGEKPNSDGLGQVIDSVTVTDPAGRQESYVYDVLDGGRLISYSNGVDPAEGFGYDAAGYLTSVADQDGNLVCFTNDAQGNVLTRTWYPVEPASLPGGGLGASANCGGSTTSDPSCWSDGNPCTTFYSYEAYDSANPLDPLNGKLTAVRDGRSASATDNTYATTYTYNGTGQLLTEATPPTTGFSSGRTTTYGYTAGTETAYGGQGTEPAGLLASEKTPGGALTTFAYYSDGDLAEVTDQSGRTTVYTYDSLGRVLTSTVTTSTSQTTTYTYTSTNQVATVTYPPVLNLVTKATHTLQETYSYDADGNELSLVQSDLTGGDPSRTTSYSYDDDDQLASVTQPAGATSGGTSQTGGASSPYPLGATTSYLYDDLGNVTQVTQPNGTVYAYDYNEYNKPTDVKLYTGAGTEATPSATCAAPAVQDNDGLGCDVVLDSYSYDPAGLLASTTDAMGRITNYTYDNNQDLIASEVTDPTTSPTTGRQTIYGYDGAGNLVSTTANGLTGGSVKSSTVTSSTVNAADQVTSVVADQAPSGGGSGYGNRTTAYTYNADGQVLAQTVGTAAEGGTSVTDYGYDLSGDMLTKTVVDGSTSLETSWTYDQNGLPLSMTTPDGNASGAPTAGYTTFYSYDPAGDLVTETGPSRPTQTYAAQTAASTSPVTTYGYDTFGDQTQVTDPNGNTTVTDPDGNTTVTAYDGDGRPTSVTQPSYTPPGASSPVGGTTAYAYDENGNLASQTDPAGNVTSYTYDALGDVLTKTDPQVPGQSAPGTWTYTYDADGEQLSATDPLGHTSQATYNYYGEQATTTDPLNNTTTYTYDFLGDQTKVTSPDGVATTNGYDHLGELTSTTDAYGNTTSYQYDDAGRLAYAYNPDGSFAKSGYDQAGNLTSITDYGTAPSGQPAPQLRTASFAYDPNGNVTSATDWDGHTSTYAYDQAGELTSAVQPVSSSASITTSYGYDPAGNQTAVTSGNGNTTWTTYNSRNLPESVIEPATAAAPTAANRTWTTAYDALGQPAQVTQPGGITQAYQYDPLGDLTSESGSGAAATTVTQTFGYNLDGQPTSASAPGGSDAFSYDNDGRLTGASGPSGTSGFTYNGDGLVTAVTSPAGTTSYTYDSADRLATESDPLSGASMTWAYNADSLPTSVSYATGGTAGPVQAFSYDTLNRLASDTVTSAGGTTLASESYGYDANGNLTSQATGGLMRTASTTYGYDWSNRIISAVTGGTTTPYGYDADGNLTQNGSATNAYNAQDQLTASTTSAGSTNYTYTLSGALTSVTPPGGTTQNYTSDAFGETITAPGGISYAYDGLGRLATRTSGTGTTTDMSYLGTSTALASDGTYNYSYAPTGAMTGVERTASGSTGYATMSDLHGDLAATFSSTSTASGLAGYATYSAYGTPTTSGYNANVGYQGNYTDPSTGLVNMGARWYNPATGGFTSNDAVSGSPLSSTVDGNPYAYADGNPLTGTDPTGHSDCGSFTIGGYVVPVPCPSGGGNGGGDGGGGIGIGQCNAGNNWCGLGGQTGTQGQGQTGGQTGTQGQGQTGGSCYIGACTTPVTFTGGGTGCWYYCYPGSGSVSDGGGSAGGGGGYSGGGGGGGGGTVWVPPPPPQNCYAALTCAPTPLPVSLQHLAYLSSPVHDTVNIQQLIKQNRFVAEQPPQQKTAVGGTKQAVVDPDSSNDETGDNVLQVLQPINILGVAALPIAPWPTLPPGGKQQKQLQQLAKQAADVAVQVVSAAYQLFTQGIEQTAQQAFGCVAQQNLADCGYTALNIVTGLATDGEGDAAVIDESAGAAADVGGSGRVRILYRGDHRTSDVIYAKGKIEPAGTSTDLRDYALNNTPSIYVGASRRTITARNAVARRGGWVYKIAAPVGEGISVNGLFLAGSPLTGSSGSGRHAGTRGRVPGSHFPPEAAHDRPG
jgi:RHS repeat-associated protein